MREKDAKILVGDGALADYFEATARFTRAPQIALNLILGELLRLQTCDRFFTTVSHARLGELCNLLESGEINHSTAKKLLLRLTEGDFDLAAVIEREMLSQIRDEAVLGAILDEVLAANARAVADYRNGKKAAMRALQGTAMAKTAGRADPVLLEKLLVFRLESDTKGE